MGSQRVLIALEYLVKPSMMNLFLTVVILLPGFFRPTSPSPSADPSSSRGRDRTKKSSRFSLKKFLRIGNSSTPASSKEEDRKQFKETVKRAEREAKKSKLNIIHPLDYNQTGVQVGSPLAIFLIK